VNRIYAIPARIKLNKITQLNCIYFSESTCHRKRQSTRSFPESSVVSTGAILKTNVDTVLQLESQSRSVLECGDLAPLSSGRVMRVKEMTL
jgi:hypothetical protein